MSDIPRRLKQLEKLLASLDDDEAMLLSELDGFLAGILVCPDLIMPSEWLPMVWGRGNKDAAPVFENTNQAEQLVGLIMERYNAIAAELQRGGGHYEPLFDIDTRHNEILWEIWIGFRHRPATAPRSLGQSAGWRWGRAQCTGRPRRHCADRSW
jgi:uncharacterized protein